MALPILETATYELTLPSSDVQVQYRPFLVKEQKLLMMAQESDDPKELEARLTITIVCLLSLIAYNFVIDSELPKLEYLTVLDWIVLISYIYATVPNFLSIISFRLQKTNLKMSDKLEQISKRYGLSSYVLSIFLIILLNANINPDNSSSLISWMAGK